MLLVLPDLKAQIGWLAICGAGKASIDHLLERRGSST
jgi:hypothetical protein